MDDCFDLIDRMIGLNARVSTECRYGKTNVTLTEPQCAESSVTIRNLPNRCIVMSLDDHVKLNSVFKGSMGECKRSDYVILADYNGTLVIVHIEIKLTKAAWSEVCKQLAGSLCFAKYMKLLGQTFGNQNDFLRDARHRFVYFTHTGPQKRKTEISRTSGDHSTPKTAMKIGNPNYLPFSKIAGGI